ncbi:chorismate synthase [Caldicoprobacter algeriensis]|uniref:chorismate synthase n=1 Tax=Caldicoprobacter algeriensis TaxID=699281 RepID=UPI00207A2B6D|nr:chorismate synthase [Caldicoprobacter algeriensis]MCM8900979.1 chorismate synthase [Caldicoprobacter algeriensis]
MSGSTIGKNFTVTTWGESHGKALGVVVDGCPAGIPLCEEDIQKDLNRRRPGQSPYSTSRQEGDKVTILSGVFEGLTTGTPISLIIPNEDQRSKDYSQIAHVYRPGHADYTYHQKYGIWDYRGGGRASGRETAARVAAGAIAKKVLSQLGVKIQAYTLSIGPIKINREKFDENEIYRNQFAMPDCEAAKKAAEYIQQLKEKGDSAGGVVECVIQGLPSGVGEPVFDKLDAALAKAIMSIGAVKGIEFGRGFEAAYLTGSQNNDPLTYDPDKGLIKLTNNSGGITGGISEGFPIVFRATFKPTPSIRIPQNTVTHDMQNTQLKLTGRHDPVIVPRAVVVVEAMAAITVVDLLFQRILSRIDLIKKALS